MTVLVPMPEGVILHPRLAADRRYWLARIADNLRVRGDKRHPLRSIRRAIRDVNHGTMHSGKRYRQCYRMAWLEP